MRGVMTECLRRDLLHGGTFRTTKFYPDLSLERATERLLTEGSAENILELKVYKVDTFELDSEE